MLHYHCVYSRGSVSTITAAAAAGTLTGIERHMLGGREGGREPRSRFVQRDHFTALRAVQDPSMTPTSLLGVWG